VNKDLYNSSKGEIEFPKDKKEHMKKCFHMVKGADENTEGFNRNKELQNQNFIEYKQLKRIKNFFDNFIGNQNEPSFILNGGVIMKNWVNDELRKMREFGDLTKRNKMDTGMQNSYIKPHEKKDFTNVRKSQEHSKTVERHDEAVTNTLKRINEIMLKL
jgi:SpoVK/Ycf46/Vps4 family AAA+-type ATPase